MKQLIIEPVMFECTLKECPPGLFVFDNELCIKSEYYTQHENRSVMEVFVASSGEYFWGGVNTYEARDKLMVIPCDWKWDEQPE